MPQISSSRPNRRSVLAAATLGGFLALAAAPALAQEKTVTIAFQTGADPAKVAQADGLYEKATGYKINWRKFDTGADVIAAIASGDVQIGYVGSSPLAAGATREVPFQTILVADLIGEAEALVARTAAKIEKPGDLKGKKIAVPFVSTTHYSLLASLKHWNIDAKSVEILNLRPPEIVAAWERGDIDAAYVWDPALAKLKASGKVLISSKEVAAFGAPTFDAWIARKDFSEKNPEFVAKFVKITTDAYAAYNKNPAVWDAKSEPVAKIAKLIGEKPEDIPESLRGSVYPSLSDELSPQLLGGGTEKAIAATAAFLKEQGKVPAVLGSYAPYVETRFAKAAASTN